MKILPCNQPSFVRLLADMHRMLIEDERADGPPAWHDLEGQVPVFVRRRGEERVAKWIENEKREYLEKQMARWLDGNHNAYCFVVDGTIIGYALVETGREPLYLRHFFIRREYRRMGHGKSAFHALLAYLKASTIDLDVFVWNARGRAFWRSLGFADRAVILRYGQL